MVSTLYQIAGSFLGAYLDVGAERLRRFFKNLQSVFSTKAHGSRGMSKPFICYVLNPFLGSEDMRQQLALNLTMSV
jgi:hypothetical protein